jgi:molybdate transport system substrate-binding protein
MIPPEIPMRRTVLILLLFVSPLVSAETVRIAVAANFKWTLEQISKQFEAETGQRVTLSSASTGVLYSQIRYGAPFDLFFAADRATPEKLAAAMQDTAGSATFCYARGSLVLAGGDGRLAQLSNPLLSLAIANPVTAPYGRAAMQVLAREEFKSGNQRKMVRGNNVVQTYQFWHSGAIELALLPRALVPDGATPVPLEWHQPLEQHAVILNRNSAVDAYLNWIRSDNVRSLITDAGYETCP